MVYEKENKTVCRRAVRDVSCSFHPSFRACGQPFCFGQRKGQSHGKRQISEKVK